MDARQAIRNIMEGAPSWGRFVSDLWVSTLSKPSLQKWAGYVDLDGLEYLGSGANGRAWLLPSRNVLKLTFDPTEAEASNKIKGRRLSNVVRIYKVSEVFVKKDLIGKRLYAILQDYVPNELDDFESALVNDIASIMFTYAGERDVKEEAIAWELSSTRKDFIEYITNYTESVTRALRTKSGKKVLYDVIRGLTSLRRSGVGYADLQMDNVRKSATGSLILFDLGASRTRQPVAMDVIERKFELDR